jgi:hemerythrin-like metal-binding protein
MEQTTPLFRWIEAYQLGIQEFDAHHQKLVQLLNSSYDAFLNNMHPHGLATILDELSDYTQYHFSAEEAWMADQNYPNRAEHQVQHDSFKAKLAELQQARQKVDTALNAELFSFLADWLAAHILESDAAYGAYTRENASRCSNNSSSTDPSTQKTT